MKSFRNYIVEAARSRGEQMEHAIVTAINGDEQPQPKIELGAGKKVAEALGMNCCAAVLGASQIEVTDAWSQFWPGGKVPGSTKTPKTDIKVAKSKISLKTGDDAQLMTGGKHESTATFFAALDKSKSKPSDMMKRIEEGITQLSGSAVAAGQTRKEIKKGTDKRLMKANAIHKVLQEDMRKMFSSDPKFAYHFCYEAMTGEAKFGGNDGTCSHFLTCTFDGDNAHLIPVTDKGYVSKIAKRINVTVRFKSASEKRTVNKVESKTGRYRYWSVVSLIADKLNEEIDMAGNYLTEGRIRNIINRMKAFVARLWNKVKDWLAKSWSNIFTFLDMKPDVNHINKLSFAP